MNKILTLTIAVAVSLGTVSCVKDFTARNTNQEQANEEMMDHDNMRTGSYISQMIANVLPSYQNDGSNEYGSASYQVVQGLTGNIFANYEAASNSGFHQTNEYFQQRFPPDQRVQPRGRRLDQGPVRGRFRPRHGSVGQAQRPPGEQPL